MGDVLTGYKSVREELNNISCSMCLAKWKQVTLHLQTGHTHSCHHPATHKIPLEEIEVDPSALHNTKFKKEQRAKMLKGERPEECDYCWTAEDSSDGSTFSDRITKSAEEWAWPEKDIIAKSSPDENTNPSYVEVSFSNACNFACTYCSPEISSTWMQEIQKHGGYTETSYNFNNLDWIKQNGKMPIPHREHNPYVEAFWKWWPKLYPDLHTFRITGGEPLMAKDTFKVLDYIIENPNPNLELNINSNLCVPDGLVDKMIEKAKRIQGEGLIKDFKIYTSAEAHGKRAEYIRHGMDYNQWIDNCDKVLTEIPDCKITNMATYNSLSLSSYQDLMKDLLDLRKKHHTDPAKSHAVSLDVSYLRWPPHQSILIVQDDNYLKMLEDQVTWMFQNKEHSHWPPLCGIGMYDYEINRLQRIYWVMQQSPKHIKEKELIEGRKNFVAFFDEHDKRRGKNFLEVFPEMEDFYWECKTL